MSENNRTRTITWDDPLQAAEYFPKLSGLEFVRGVLEGKLAPPPIAHLMNITLTEVEEGRVVFQGVPQEYHYNPIGMVHGGFLATITDSAMGCAVQTTLPIGVTYTTLEIKVNYVRPLTKDTGVVTCEAKIIHTGRRMAMAESRVTDTSGKLYGHATTTCAVFTPGV